MLARAEAGDKAAGDDAAEVAGAAELPLPELQAPAPAASAKAKIAVTQVPRIVAPLCGQPAAAHLPHGPSLRYRLIVGPGIAGNKVSPTRWAARSHGSAIASSPGKAARRAGHADSAFMGLEHAEPTRPSRQEAGAPDQTVETREERQAQPILLTALYQTHESTLFQCTERLRGPP